MKTIDVRRGYSDRFCQRAQPVVSLSGGRAALVLDPGVIALVGAEDVADGYVYADDVTTFPAMVVNAGEAPLAVAGVGGADVGRVERLAVAHLRRYRYAVDCRQYVPGDCVPPDEGTPVVCSIAQAREALAVFGRQTGSDHGWEQSGEWVSASHGWVYSSLDWDGVSFGDPVGVMSFGRRGGVRFERY